jgi:hypothetical protein
VRTVFNEAVLQQIVRHLATLLALLFLMPALAGCLGASPVGWGTGDGEYSVDLDESALTASITNKLADNKGSQLDDLGVDLIGCEGETFILSGWLAQTRSFEKPTGNYKAVTSWMIQQMSYEEAKDTVPGTVHVTIVSAKSDWGTPTSAYALPPGKADRKAFPHDDWALIGIIPGNENVLEAAMMMDTNQAVLIHGYFVGGTQGGTDTGPLPLIGDACDLNLNNEGWDGHFVVTSLTYGTNDRVVDADTAYIAGDIPVVGRGIYTVILMLSIVGAGAMFIFSRNALVMSADEGAQSMLSEQQMRAGKAAAHEAARHEARIEAQSSAREAEASGKRRPKGSEASPRFDIGAALSQGEPGQSESRYVAGTGATATEDSERMDSMIHEMQEDLAIEQELQAKGLRGIVSDLSSGAGPKGRVSAPPSQGASEPAEEPAAPSKKRVTRKTRKTQKIIDEEEAEEEEAEPTPRGSAHIEGPDLADDEEFSDFNF